MNKEADITLSHSPLNLFFSNPSENFTKRSKPSYWWNAPL